MRWAFALLLGSAAACSFDAGVLPPDARIEIDAAPDALVPTWDVDGTSGIGVPRSSSEWTELVAAHSLMLASPAHTWLFQETSGTLADSIGTATLTPYNIPSHIQSYGLSINGWSRYAVATPELAGDHGFATSALGNLDGTPYAVMLYIAIRAVPSSTRAILGLGSGGDHRYAAITPAGVIAASGNGGSPTSTGAVALGTNVLPVVMVIDPSASRYAIYTDQERIVATWTPTMGLGNLFIVGNAVIGAASIAYLYGATWTGAGATLDDAAVKRLLQSLGWTVSGY